MYSKKECDLQRYEVVAVPGRYSIMTGTHLYVLGSGQRHSELTEEMYVPFRPITEEDILLQ